ncbi:hypothetical protein LCGC14_0585030 [marine sediment metagenome]|uniref:Uncharacterized protein n=1 Tax=marine sediment metagenome TaxID=412755 RepID=A0A0F9U1A2_9ZZZZ
MAVTVNKMTLISLTPTGRKNHEDMTAKLPYSTVMSALYEAVNGLTLEDISERTNMDEGRVKSILGVLYSNRLITTSQPSGAEAPTIKV